MTLFIQPKLNTQDYYITFNGQRRLFTANEISMHCEAQGMTTEDFFSYPLQAIGVAESLFMSTKYNRFLVFPSLSGAGRFVMVVLLALFMFCQFMIVNDLSGQEYLPEPSDGWVHGDEVAELCDQLFFVYGIPQEVTYSIYAHESGYGKFPDAPTAKNRNNYFGLGGDREKLWKFHSMNESFWAFGRSMKEDFDCIHYDYEIMLRCLNDRGYATSNNWLQSVLKIAKNNK